MIYKKKEDKHLIVLDDEESKSLIAVLNSCNLTERRVFNKLKTTLENEIFGK